MGLVTDTLGGGADGVTLLCGLYEGDWNVDEEEEVAGCCGCRDSGGSGFRGLDCLLLLKGTL